MRSPAWPLIKRVRWCGAPGRCSGSSGRSPTVGVGTPLVRLPRLEGGSCPCAAWSPDRLHSPTAAGTPALRILRSRSQGPSKTPLGSQMGQIGSFMTVDLGG
ncbi:hypothetical protein NDU88_006731 [Pleurodeles waltl]|uniref:Uncharacterized protein n=1 Tax=Pleurodeles waltl TaxID=8319 RepID=A0AAV7X2D2_PLEWA|nr:hypothetical protein NDU88_006731 [Pleurodeles waltl]